VATVSDLTDQELIGEIRGGSSAAFERLMQRYERLVYRVALGFTGDPDSALDVTQNVFVRVHAKLGTWRGDGGLRNWIARVATNEARNWNRGERRHRSADLTELDDAPAGAAASEQEDGLRRRELRRVVRRSLDALSPRQRRAVVLRYFGDLPIHDIAAALDCSEGVAKNVLFRSLKRMRSFMEASTEVRG
jgi:RNA polymerase sigma-70 factor (ECF subfamily)